MDLLSQDAYHTKDITFKETHKIRDNNSVVILSGDKDSSVIIMNRSDYTKNEESMEFPWEVHCLWFYQIDS